MNFPASKEDLGGALDIEETHNQKIDLIC